jgi:hypothetical protein
MARDKIETQAITETSDPALWAIVTALSVAVIYLACLT